MEVGGQRQRMDDVAERPEPDDEHAHGAGR
jgi:hypothetical protein